MSKVSTFAERASEAPLKGKEAQYLANRVIKGDETLTQTQIKENYDKASTAIEDAMKRFDKRMTEMMKQEADITVRTDKHMKFIKNACGQIGDSMSRIDKLVAVDFEKKLELLERFANAANQLCELQEKCKLKKLIEALE